MAFEIWSLATTPQECIGGGGAPLMQYYLEIELVNFGLGTLLLSYGVICSLDGVDLVLDTTDASARLCFDCNK